MAGGPLRRVVIVAVALAVLALAVLALWVWPGADASAEPPPPASSPATTDSGARAELVGADSGPHAAEVRAPIAYRFEEEERADTGSERRNRPLITGQVVNRAGVPLVHARVSLAEVTDAGQVLEPFRRVVTDERGFGFQVSPATYELTATHAEGVARIVVTAPATDLQVVASGLGTRVTGRVLEEGGAGLAGYDVGLYTAADRLLFEAVAETVSADGGTFDLGPQAPGRYTLRARAARGTADDRDQRAAVVTSPEQDLVRVELRFARGRSLRGTVVDERGQPVTNAEVFALAGAAGEERRSATRRTDADGRFSFEALDEGAWNLSASAPEFTEAFVLDVRAGAPDLQMVLHHSGRITGRFVGPDGHPVADFTLSGQRFTSPTGAFSIAVQRTGLWPVLFRAPGLGACVRALPGKLSETTDVGAVEAVQRASVRFNVLDGKTRQPIAGVAVTYSVTAIDDEEPGPDLPTGDRSFDEEVLTRAKTDAEGNVTLPAVCDPGLFVAAYSWRNGVGEVVATVGAPAQTVLLRPRRRR